MQRFMIITKQLKVCKHFAFITWKNTFSWQKEKGKLFILVSFRF